MKRRTNRILLLAVLSLCACMGSDGFEQGNVRYSFFDFSDGLQNWKAGFAGHSITSRQDESFDVSHSRLPALFNESKALEIKGKNQGDTLFMFIKRQIHGLDPNTQYQLDCEVRLISELLTDTDNNQDIEVFFKYGSSVLEPQVAENEERGKFELSLDAMGSQESGGVLKYVQKINPPVSRQTPGEQIINSFNVPIRARTDAEGKLWVLMGTELLSQVEMAFYYNTIVIYYTRL